MSDELDPLDDDLREHLREARDIPELGDGSKAAILRSVASRLTTCAPPFNVAHGSSLAMSVPKALAVLAGTFTLGVGTGFVLAPRHVSEAVTTTTTAPTTPVVASQPEPVPPSRPPDIQEAPSPPSLTKPPTTRSPACSSVPSASGLTAERGLLDIARSALIGGEATDALRATQEHERRYPNGALTEEREAIAIKALLALGRREEARRRADAFATRYPGSLALRAVRAALAEHGADAK